MINKRIIKNFQTFLKYKEKLIFLLIFLIYIFLRTYKLRQWAHFGWDQVDNAWAAKDIIIDHRWKLIGMQAKGQSGFFIGPVYYYFAALFYWIFDLDPIASPVIALTTSIFTFLTFYFVIKKIFSEKLALITLFIYTISNHLINFDRVQWPVNFIPLASLWIFYFLYNVLIGNIRYLPLLALALGFSFNIHFTSAFYIVIIFASLPLTFLFLTKEKKKKILKYILISLPVFLIWFVPNIISELSNKGQHSSNMINYINTFYHGIHLVRILQLFTDALIEYEPILFFPNLKPIKYLLLPLFLLIYFFQKPTKKKFVFSYLFSLWFLVPWFVLSTYSGQISNYYFSLTIPFVLLTLSFITLKIYELKFFLVKIFIVGVWGYYSFFNLKTFISGFGVYCRLPCREDYTKGQIAKGYIIGFKEGAPDSYLYYLYEMYRKKND